MSTAKHGTQYSYTTNGCRCPLCRDAHRKANKLCERNRVKALKQQGFTKAFVTTNPATGTIQIVTGYSKITSFTCSSPWRVETTKLKIGLGRGSKT